MLKIYFYRDRAYTSEEEVSEAIIRHLSANINDFDPHDNPIYEAEWDNVEIDPPHLRFIFMGRIIDNIHFLELNIKAFQKANLVYMPKENRNRVTYPLVGVFDENLEVYYGYLNN